MVQPSLNVFCLILFTVSATLSCNVGNSHAASTRKYQHHVSIRFRGDHVCSGSIIDARHILTSSACILGTEPEDMIVVAGTNSLSNGGDLYEIQKTITPDSIFDDIALLRTKREITFHRGVRKIEIENYNDYDKGSRIKVIGWEIPSLDEPRRNDMLQEFSLQLYDKERCKRENGWSNNKVMCIFEPHGRTLCNRDAGGAIIADGRQIGIFLKHGSCYNARNPFPHTAVYEYLDWIKKNLKLKENHDGTFDPPRSDDKFPYHVSVRRNKQHICSGSIINERHILTSNICVMSTTARDLTVVAGINSLKEKAKFYRVQKIVPTYNYDYDIAILRVTRNIIFDDRVNSIPIIQNSYDLNDFDELTLTGWEQETHGWYRNDKLLRISYEIYDREKCKRTIPFLSDAYMCAIGSSSGNACDIDYGSPVVANGVQVALNPEGAMCGNRDEPRLLLPLSKHSLWIRRNSRP